MSNNRAEPVRARTLERICIVIPCYNEARRLPVDEVCAFYESSTAASLCFVDDGSSDATAAILRGLRRGREARVHLLELSKNVGKAEAVRRGVLHMLDGRRFDAIGYLDADLAAPLDQMHLLEAALDEDQRVQMAFGCRIRLVGRQVQRSAWRHCLGRLFATCARVTIGLPVYDTQCGAKLMRPALAAYVFADAFIDRWLFDLEIFARIVKRYGRAGAERVLREVPLQTWREKPRSRIAARYLVRVPVHLLRIRHRYFWR